MVPASVFHGLIEEEIDSIRVVYSASRTQSRVLDTIVARFRRSRLEPLARGMLGASRDPRNSSPAGSACATPAGSSSPSRPRSGCAGQQPTVLRPSSVEHSGPTGAGLPLPVTQSGPLQPSSRPRHERASRLMQRTVSGPYRRIRQQHGAKARQHGTTASAASRRSRAQAKQRGSDARVTLLARWRQPPVGSPAGYQTCPSMRRAQSGS